MARNYGTSKGVEGRLLNRQELEDISCSDYPEGFTDLLVGHWNEEFEYGRYMQFWLGDYDTNRVLYADASTDGWYDYTDGWGTEPVDIGVRPVLIVPKSQS